MRTSEYWEVRYVFGDCDPSDWVKVHLVGTPVRLNACLRPQYFIES